MNPGLVLQSPTALFAAVAAAHALAVVSPGPDLAMVVRRTLARGRAAGVRTALGIASGIAFHVGYSLFGLSWVIENQPGLLVLLRYSGAVLLLYLGVHALCTRAPAAGSAPAPEVAPAGGRADFGIGFLTNALNVKAMLFFVALGSAIAGGGTSAGLRLALGAWMILATAAWFCAVAATLGHPRLRPRLVAHHHWLDRIMGAILVGLGLLLLSQAPG